VEGIDIASLHVVLAFLCLHSNTASRAALVIHVMAFNLPLIGPISVLSIFGLTIGAVCSSHI